MKVLTIIFLTCVLALSAFSQTTSETQSLPLTGTTPAQTSPLFLNSDKAELASAQESSNSEYAEADYRGRGGRAELNCARIRRQRTMGIIFTAIGGGLLASGIAMTIVGNNAIYNSGGSYNQYGYYYSNAPQGDYALRDGGFACSVLGAIGLAIGIPNLIIGSVRYRKYCGGQFDRDRRAYIEMHPGLNTMGVAMKF